MRIGLGVVIGVLVGAAAAAQPGTMQGMPPIHEEFPVFAVPGHEAEMESLRHFFWLHYRHAGPKATLWDEWLSSPALWPAAGEQAEDFRQRWRRALQNRDISPEGYVATHQHDSIAHPQGWPFPFWRQGTGWGHHFQAPRNLHVHWHAVEPMPADPWATSGIEAHGVEEAGWHLSLTAPHAQATITEGVAFDAFESPFLQLRWQATGLGNAQPYIEWTTDDAGTFSAARRVHFPPVESDSTVREIIPMYRHPEWQGRITGLRIGFANPGAGAEVFVRALFTTYDTRHTINNPNFVLGASNYFRWTGDINFLREEINRMRLATRYAIQEFQTETHGVVVCSWVGHDGRSGHIVHEDGTRTLIPGQGIGQNYWDLMPFGHKDAYATYYFHEAILRLAEIERAIAEHPEWNIPMGVHAFDPGWLEEHAAFIRTRFNEVFWNEAAGRYACSIDIEGTMWDYGYTFLNLEAIHYGMAPPEQAAAILEWVRGERAVEGDTSTGDDIYHWRFGPRATTRRNIEYYQWVWADPASIPWGGQVQDGGAVLGFSYHDLMARLLHTGPDDAWQRLQAIIAWYDEVRAAGGYREFYADGPGGATLQGGGTAGGLGLDYEFFESVLVPTVLLDGFLGFRPTVTGAAIAPRLPSGWPALRIERIALKDTVIAVAAQADGTVSVEVIESTAAPDAAPLVLTAPGDTEHLLPRTPGASVTLQAGTG